MSDVSNDIWDVSGDFSYIRDYLKTARLANMTRATTRKLFKKPIENVASKAVDYSLPKIQDIVGSSDYNTAMVNNALTKDASWQRESYRIRTSVTNKGACSTIQPIARTAPPQGDMEGYAFPNGGIYYIQTLAKDYTWDDPERYRKFLSKDGRWVTTHHTHREGHMINWSQIEYFNSDRWIDGFYDDLYRELDKNGFSVISKGLKESHSGDYPIPDISDFMQIDIT